MLGIVFAVLELINRLMPVLIPNTTANSISTVVSCFQAGSLHMTTRDAFARGYTNNKQNSINDGHKTYLQFPVYLMRIFGC